MKTISQQTWTQECASQAVEIENWEELEGFLNQDKFGMPLGMHSAYEAGTDTVICQEDMIAGNFEAARIECESTAGMYGPREYVAIKYSGPVNDRYLD
jgi:hypothetical protein